MSNDVKARADGSRAYDSPVREARARETERRVLDAAEACFAEHGYVRTTIAAIAARADVDPRTVYKIFGTKVGLLSRLVDVAMAGDQEAVPVMERASAARAFDAPTADERIAAFASTLRHLMEQAGVAFRTAAQAAVAESEAAALWTVGQRKREQDATAFVAALEDAAMLRTDRTPAHAVTTVWLVSSPETYLQLTDGLGWSLDDYERWVAQSLTDALTPN